MSSVLNCNQNVSKYFLQLIHIIWSDHPITPFSEVLIRKFESKNDICELRKELEFYKSVFKSHRNSLVSQVKIKTINGRKVWIDHIRDDKKFIESLDRDEEVEEWLKPIKAER